MTEVITMVNVTHVGVPSGIQYINDYFNIELFGGQRMLRILNIYPRNLPDVSGGFSVASFALSFGESFAMISGATE